MEIGVLDYALIDEGEQAREALANTVRLAQTAEALGYKRFWVAEHHNVPAFASSSPALIALEIANHTQQIRVGSGGVMLPHYSPLNVAENFRVLSAYAPGRVDLGVGDNPGTGRVKRAMQDNKGPGTDYLAKIDTLAQYVTTAGPIAETEVAANPIISEAPEMWMLSTSVSNAIHCAERGLAYCFGLFPFASKDGLAIGQTAVRAYREHFKPSALLKAPQTMVAIFVSVAEDPLVAKGLTRAIDCWLLGREDFSYFKRFPSIATAERYVFTPQEEERVQANRTRMAHGTVAEVSAQLQTLVATIGADELLLMPLIPGIERRIEALTRLKAALG